MNKYYKDILRLTVSIIPKLTTVAVSMNIALRNRYPHILNLYDTEDKRTWIYYKNLKGERFKTLDGVYLQSEVYINTIEDDTYIPLTKLNLDDYNLTRLKLQEMGSTYKSLVNDYKDQELRIRSIIFDTVVDPLIVPDGTILLVNNDLIEYNEYTLISRLEKRIKNYLSRWDVKDFVLGDKEYAPTLVARLTYFIFLNIINIKSSNINTLEVDAYHMRNYFNSNLRLGNIVNVLPNNIKFWMYKNLSTLIHGMGSNQTLKTIADEVLTPSGIVMNLFNVHPVEPSLLSIEDGVYNKDRLFTDASKTNISVENLLFKERDDNSIVDFVYQDTGYRDSIFRNIASIHGEVEPTKVIMLKEKRVKLLPSMNVVLITLEACISYLNTTSATYEFNDKETGITYKMRSKDVLYTILLIMRNMNNRIPNIGNKLYIRNLLHPMVLTTGLNSTLLGDETLQPTVDVINGYIGTLPITPNKDSVSSYIDNMVNAHTTIHYYIANMESSKSRDTMRRLQLKSSTVKDLDIDNLENFDKYMLENNIIIIDPNTRSKDKWISLLNVIVEEVVGRPLINGEKGRLDIFKDMLEKLTSYSVQVLTDRGGLESSTLEGTIGYHSDIGGMRIIDVSVDCGNNAPKITSVTGNDGRLDNTLFTIGIEGIQIIETPIINLTRVGPIMDPRVSMVTL